MRAVNHNATSTKETRMNCTFRKFFFGLISVLGLIVGPTLPGCDANYSPTDPPANVSYGINEDYDLNPAEDLRPTDATDLDDPWLRCPNNVAISVSDEGTLGMFWMCLTHGFIEDLSTDTRVEVYDPTGVWEVSEVTGADTRDGYTVGIQFTGVDQRKCFGWSSCGGQKNWTRYVVSPDQPCVDGDVEECLWGINCPNDTDD